MKHVQRHYRTRPPPVQAGWLVGWLLHMLYCIEPFFFFVCVSVCVCAHACVCACVRGCMHACVRVSVCVYLPSCNIQEKSYAHTVINYFCIVYSRLLCFYKRSFIFFCLSHVVLFSFFSCPLIVLSSHTNKSSLSIFQTLCGSIHCYKVFPFSFLKSW